MSDYNSPDFSVKFNGVERRIVYDYTSKVNNDKKRDSLLTKNVRYVMGTIGKSSEQHYLTHNNDEIEYLKSVFETISNKDSSIVLAYEQYDCDNTQWHIHIGILYSKALRFKKIACVFNKILEHFPWADILLEQSSNKAKLLNYIYKHRNISEPVVIGKLPETDIAVSKAISSIPEHTLHIRSKAIKEKTQTAVSLIARLKSYMIENNIKVNFHTRRLMQCRTEIKYERMMKNFQQQHDIISEYGVDAPKKCYDFVTNKSYQCLPDWDPDLDVIQFSDCLYSLGEGIVIEKSESGLEPFYISDQNFPGVYPTSWLQCVRANKFDMDEWISAFKIFYLKPVRRHKCLYIYGEPMTGKSTLIEPYQELYKGLVTNIAMEGKFTFSKIGDFPNVIMNEFDVNALNESIDTFKNLAEKNDETVVQVKNGQQKTVRQKNIAATSNNDLIATDYADRKEQINIKAVRSRFNIFKTCSNISFNPDPEIINNIYREAASIAVLCTQKKSYVKL